MATARTLNTVPFSRSTFGADPRDRFKLNHHCLDSTSGFGCSEAACCPRSVIAIWSKTSGIRETARIFKNHALVYKPYKAYLIMLAGIIVTTGGNDQRAELQHCWTRMSCVNVQRFFRSFHAKLLINASAAVLSTGRYSK